MGFATFITPVYMPQFLSSKSNGLRLRRQSPPPALRRAQTSSRKATIVPAASLTQSKQSSTKSESVNPGSDHPQQEDNSEPPQDPEQKRRDVSRLLSLFGRLAVPYWKQEASARRDLAALVALAIAQSGVSVLFSYVSRDFWTALNTKDADLFYHQAFLFFGVLVAATPVVVYYHYLRDVCSLRWRDWITTKVVSQYFSSRNFYYLESQPSVDNPDQRIAQDLNSFTTESIAFILTLLVSSVDLICFSSILFSIYPILFGVLLLYATTGTIATALVGKELVSLNYQQLVREADLRYGLVRMRENAESIAFFQGEKREKAEILRRLETAVGNMASVINLRRKLGFLQNGYKYAVQVLPAICVAPRYFAGAIQLGSVTQSFSAFSHILGDLSLVVNRFDSLSQFGAGIDRLAEFVQTLERNVEEKNRTFRAEEDSAKEKKSTASTTIQRVVIDSPALYAEDMTLLTPVESVQRELISNLTFAVEAGHRLLVAGPSGTGKSSLLRAIAGLWENGSGCIKGPDIDKIFFLPQKPYCTLGTLRANLVYPENMEDTPAAYDDQALLKIMDIVDLAELPLRMGGLDAVVDWADTLSLGEQQRLQFARLLFSKCKVVIIDEGTSALSIEAERRMYGATIGLGITVVSVGHRPSLLNYHDSILRLGSNDGTSWKLSKIEQEDKDKIVFQSL